MKIAIYCIGSLKERYWKEAVEEYKKRLSAYCEILIEEFPDFPTPENASEATETAIKEKEAAKVLSRIKSSDYVIAMDLNKKEYDSPAFSEHLSQCFVRGGSSVVFLLGGSLGLSDSLKQRANESISFGKMTFPHQLARIMLLEQLYRAFRIARHEPYHK